MKTGDSPLGASTGACVGRLEGPDDMISEHGSKDMRAGAVVCDGRGCRHREILRHTLADAIEALEATRKAFKSKQIEALRRRLMRVLIEEG